MSDLAGDPDHPLLDALSALHRLIADNPEQTVVQLSEGVVIHWTRVLDGIEIIQPRLNPQGLVPTAFHFGTELNPRNRIDDCGRPQGEPAGQEAFEAALRARLGVLAEELERYFGQQGYRSSSDRCDQVMLELSRLSRFLGTWALDGERARPPGGPAGEPPVDLYAPGAPTTFLGRTRWNLAFWEPYLGMAIVAWEQNALESFDQSLRSLRELLALDEEARRPLLNPPGYPLRSRGLRRLKVAVIEPENRPLRSRSVLWVRFNQLIERLRSGEDAFSHRLQDELEADVRHFLGMVEGNHFMLVFAPGFQVQGRPGVQMIRGRPGTHPILLDTAGFFKKSVLFHNGTYTRAGGGLDLTYLQLRQLERFFKFEGWSGRYRALRPPLEGCLLAWEENRWDAFTDRLLQVAEQLRSSDPEP